jgi:ABC-type lipoprotein export system ATPase subunit
VSLINSGQDVFYAITKRQTMASEKRKSLLYRVLIGIIFQNVVLLKGLSFFEKRMKNDLNSKFGPFWSFFTNSGAI